jgi:hypothetical protein
MDSHQATTPRNNPAKTRDARRLGDNQISHIASTANDVAKATRNPADGKLE